jgi:ABC-2 type transport system permease protein
MRRVWLLVAKDFRRKWKNPVVIIGFLFIPVLFTLIFGAVFGGSGETKLPRIQLLSVDLDKSFLSQLVFSALNQGELKEMIQLEPMESEEEARQRLEQGKASALLVIPENFGKDVWEGRKAELLLFKNPSEQFLPQIVEEITDTTALLFSALLSVFSDELGIMRRFSGSFDLSDQAVSMISVRIKNRIDGIAKYVFPPVIDLKQTTTEKEEEGISGALTIQSYILPAIAIMFLLFIVNIVFEDLLQERDSGTLLRMTASPMTIREFIWSKMVTAALLGMFCTFFLIGLGALIFNIKWGPPISVVLIVICLNILISGFISMFYAFIRTERQAGAVISSVIIVMSLLGGSMLPVEQFPAPIKVLSNFTINHWGLQAFLKSQSGEPLQIILPILGGMILAGVLLSLISSQLLQRNLRRGLVK